MDADLNHQNESMMLYLMLGNIASLLLIFNNNVVFRQQMLFFHSNLDFHFNKCTEFWKINIRCWKTTFLLKSSNNDVMLLPASWAHVDDSNQLPSMIVRFSKNIDFDKFWKWTLSPMTEVILQIGKILMEGLCDNKSATNCCVPLVSKVNFHLWCWSTIFGNKNNKCSF